MTVIRVFVSSNWWWSFVLFYVYPCQCPATRNAIKVTIIIIIEDYDDDERYLAAARGRVGARTSFSLINDRFIGRLALVFIVKMNSYYNCKFEKIKRMFQLVSKGTSLDWQTFSPLHITFFFHFIQSYYNICYSLSPKYFRLAIGCKKRYHPVDIGRSSNSACSSGYSRLITTEPNYSERTLNTFLRTQLFRKY